MPPPKVCTCVFKISKEKEKVCLTEAMVAGLGVGSKKKGGVRVIDFDQLNFVSGGKLGEERGGGE
jgi:hypothetical protein